MKSLLRFSLCLLVLSCMAGASSLYTFTYTGTGDYAGDSAIAFLTATDNGNGTFTAISGSGFWDVTTPIDLFLNTAAPGTEYTADGLFYFDNQLFPGNDPQLSAGGLMFSIATGNAQELNIWGLGAGRYEAMMNSGGGFSGASFGTASLSGVPEPATLPLVVSGIMGLGFGQYLRRRRR
jgi:hypothetical protein